MYATATLSLPSLWTEVCRKGLQKALRVFVMVTDEIWSELRQKWAASGHGLRCDHVDLICLGYAEYILLFSRSKASPEVMMNDCCDAFARAGLEGAWTKATGATLLFFEWRIPILPRHIFDPEKEWNALHRWHGKRRRPMGRYGHG